jgi:chemotaxis protein MotB
MLGAMRAWLLVALVLSGCVKQSTYDKAIAEREAKIADAQKQVADRDKQIADLEGTTKDKDAALAQANTDKQATDAELAELRDKRAADEKRLAAFNDLQARFKGLIDTGQLEVAFRHGQMTLKLPSGVLFPSAGADLSDGGKKTLTKVTKLLLELKDKHFLIAGHTDDVPIKNDQFANNWYLSTARAITVLQFMVDQGFPASQLAAAGYADEDPIASNKNAKGRMRNRRIEILIVPDLSELPKLAGSK